jgi:hypothetical protein
MSHFLQHIPCPRCGSKNNFGEYTDHFWCFGCKYHKHKDDIASVKERIRKSNVIKNPSDFSLNLTDDIPVKARQWLLKYGVSSQEITDFSIKWEQDTEILILLHTDIYWQGRCFGNQKVKYLSKGNKPLTYYGNGDKLVCVEDILSAIKISRASPEYCALPLLGCSLPNEWVQELSGKFTEVIVWLDRDKAKDAVKISKELRMKNFVSRVVISPLDPKEYSKGDLIEWLKRK